MIAYFLLHPQEGDALCKWQALMLGPQYTILAITTGKTVAEGSLRRLLATVSRIQLISVQEGHEKCQSGASSTTTKTV